MSGSYLSESQYNVPTTEADPDTQTGKEESRFLEEKNTKLAYSVNRVHRNEQSQPLEVSGIYTTRKIFLNIIANRDCVKVRFAVCFFLPFLLFCICVCVLF